VEKFAWYAKPQKVGIQSTENFFVYFQQFEGRKNFSSHLLVTTWPFSLFFAISLKYEKHLLIVVLGD